jgi:hypothetical protein
MREHGLLGGDSSILHLSGFDCRNDSLLRQKEPTRISGPDQFYALSAGVISGWAHVGAPCVASNGKTLRVGLHSYICRLTGQYLFYIV